MSAASILRDPWVWLTAMGLAFLTLAFSSLRVKSVTVDEFGHLPAGYNLLRTGDFRHAELNPPLVNALSALPLLPMRLEASSTATDVEVSGPYRFWTDGYRFMFDHAADYQRAFVAARSVIVLSTLLTGLLLFGWARKLVPARPDRAGLLAAGLFWFSPQILAHGRLVTTDAGAACFVALSVWAFWLFVREPNAARTLGCGAALGLAALAKFTTVFLYPVYLGLTLGSCITDEKTDRWKRLGLLLGAFAVSGLAINAGYLFQGTLQPIGSHEWVSGPFRVAERLLPDRLPVPLPEDYVEAFDRQARDARAGDPSYLFGQAYQGGRWYYFPVLLALKTPVPTILLAAIALVLALRFRPLHRFDQLVLLLPPLVLLATLSLFSDKQVGLRMILPGEPLVWLWVAATLAAVPWSRLLAGTTGLLLLWLAWEVLSIHPNYLAYFNQAAGGPSRGYLRAVDSNLDWGQDLIQLRRFMDAESIESIQLLYFGRAAPEIYGIDYVVPRDEVEPGWLAVGVSLYALPYYLYDHGRIVPTRPVGSDRARWGEPVATIGHSMHVYRVR